MNISESYQSNSLELFFRGAFSVDIVLITFHDGKLKILVENKKTAPFYDETGLPGRLILPNEDVDQALNNMMLSFIGQCDFYKKQLSTFSDLGRHLLGRVVTFAYYGLIPYENLKKDTSNELTWYEITKLPNLILDHQEIVKEVLGRFRKGLLRHPIVFDTLPEKFVISEVLAVYEQAFNQKLDVSNFRKNYCLAI